VDRLLAVTNATAGGGEDEAVEAALQVLRQTHDVEVAACKDVDDLPALLADRDGRPLVVFGGDGSLHAVATVLQTEGWLEDTLVALVPLGTGNDFARTLDLPLDPTEAARGVASAEERRIDLLVGDDGEVVVNAVHIGVGVDAAEEAADLKPRYGRFGYVLGAARAGFVSKGLRLRVVIDDVVVATGGHHVFQVAVGNGRFVGGGTPIAPDADPCDGLVDVVLSYALAPAKRFAYAFGVRMGRHGLRQDVQTYRGQRVTVTGPPFGWNVDGELHGPDTRRSWTVHAGALRFLAPSGAASEADDTTDR
jgi:diacylglycerol kinase family enzyme